MPAPTTVQHANMRFPLTTCLLLGLLLAGCTPQAHHQARDPAVEAELRQAITALLPRLEQAPAPGDWLDVQVAMLATAALLDPARITIIRSGSAKTAEVQAQSGSLIAELAKHRGLKPPLLLNFLHNQQSLSNEEQLLLYCLVLQARSEANLKANPVGLQTD